MSNMTSFRIFINIYLRQIYLNKNHPKFVHFGWEVIIFYLLKIVTLLGQIQFWKSSLE